MGRLVSQQLFGIIIAKQVVSKCLQSVEIIGLFLPAPDALMSKGSC